MFRPYPSHTQCHIVPMAVKIHCANCPLFSIILLNSSIPVYIVELVPIMYMYGIFDDGRYAINNLLF